MKTHLSHALVREGGCRRKGGENNARINISQADRESKSFYRGAASARVFPTIIIIRRDNEAREKDDRTKTGIPSTKTIVCTSTMSRRNKRGYRWCPLGKRDEDWWCGAGVTQVGGLVKPTTQQTASRCTKIGPFSLKLRLSRGWRDS